MDKGTVFERDGDRYEALESGLKYIAKQKACIRPNGASKSITIEKAVKDGLICKLGVATAGDLFTGGSGQAQSQQKRPGKVAETPGTYGGSPRAIAPEQTTFFMPVDQLRAQVFLAHGLIYPPAYDTAASSGDFRDTQGQTPNDITLFSSPPPLEKNQVCLRVLLNKDEINDSEHSSGVLRFAMPLPISRLSGIEIPREAGELSRYIDGWIKPDVPVPSHMFSIQDVPTSKAVRPAKVSAAARKGKKIEDVEESIRKFDRYLGLLAFMRNADRYFTVRKGRYSDYPPMFFACCASLMHESSLGPDRPARAHPMLLALLDQETNMTAASQALVDLVTSPSSYIEKEHARLLAKGVYNQAGDNEILGQAFKTLFTGDYRSAIPVLQKPDLPAEGAVLAALFKFSGRQSNDHRTLKQRLHDDWRDSEKVTQMLAVLGAYYGYTALDARETALYSVHPMLAALLEHNPQIKFHLSSKLERLLIESVYQWAFYRRPLDLHAADLYSDVAPAPTDAQNATHGVFVRDQSYRVRDLRVQCYEVTALGRIVQRLKDMKGSFVDESSEVGRCLMSRCFFLGEDFEVSRKRGKDTLRYRISKDRLINLIADGQIDVNLRMLETALDEDTKIQN